MATTLTKAPKLNGTTKTIAGDKPAPSIGVTIPKLSIQKMKLRVIGDSPLVCHAWSEKAKKMMLDKQMKVAKMAKEAKNPESDVVESLYWLSEKPGTFAQGKLDEHLARGRFGFPAACFKNAAVDACSFIDGITKVVARGAFFVEGDLLQITDPDTGKPAVPIMDESMVRIAMGTADIRYRGKFLKWQVDLTISYNVSVLTPDQIANLMNVAGFSGGVGEHRPQCNGSWGRFHVATAD